MFPQKYRGRLSPLSSRLICLWQEFPKSLYRCSWISVAFTHIFESQLRSDSGAPFPSASLPYRMSFGILPSSILQTCHSHRRRRCVNRGYMLGRFALSRTFVLGTLSCQAMFKVEGVEFVLMPCVAPKTRFHTEVCSARTPCLLESWGFL